jgi:hypothetical protein
MRNLLVSLFSLLSSLVFGQVNLVPNPGFEVYDSCPWSGGQLRFANPWFQPNNPQYVYSSSSEYFNSCTSNFYCDVPLNAFGNQLANTGNAYAGAGLYFSHIADDGHEYLEVGLDSNMLPSYRYCVSFYWSFADICCYPSCAMGVYLSVDTCQYNSPQYMAIPVQPQLLNSASNILSDKVNWTQLYWTYSPTDTFRFMTIGNFWDAAYNYACTDTVCTNNNGSYYFYDDFAVIRLPFIYAGVDKVMAIGDSCLLNGTITEFWPGMQFEWLPHDGLENPYSLITAASPNATTTYTLTVSCQSCNVPCLDEVVDSATVFVQEISPPQTFPFHVPTVYRTNQLFMVDSLPEGSSLAIYDVTGRIVYRDVSYQNDFSLANLSPATYLYEFILPDNRVIKGKFCVVE